MGDLTWLAYAIVAAIIAIAAWFTFRRVPEDVKHPKRPPEPPR